MMLDYLYQMGEAIEYLIAFGSLMALLGLIFGLVGFIWGSSRYKVYFTRLIAISMVLIVITGGPFTAIRYFRLHV